MAFESLGGQEGEPIFDPNDSPAVVDHVFEQYAANTTHLSSVANESLLPRMKRDR